MFFTLKCSLATWQDIRFTGSFFVVDMKFMALEIPDDSKIVGSVPSPWSTILPKSFSIFSHFDKEVSIMVISCFKAISHFDNENPIFPPPNIIVYKLLPIQFIRNIFSN